MLPKLSYDYEKQKLAWIDEDGYNYSENRLMEAGTYDENSIRNGSNTGNIVAIIITAISNLIAELIRSENNRTNRRK